MQVRLLIVDDHPVIHVGLKEIFEGTEIDVVGHAMSGQEAIELFDSVHPDVVLLDVRMPEKTGLQTLDEIRQTYADVKLIMFSTHENSTYVARAISLGADEYLLKSLDAKNLIASIKHIAAGNPAIEGGLFQSTKTSMRRRRDQSEDHLPLTNREMQVLRHIAHGLSNREVAKSLEISVETVKEHVQNILRKLDVNDRTQAAVWAVKRNLV